MINPEEIANIALAEEEMWWFRGMRRIAFALLDPVVRRGDIHCAFEGGCGTGHFAATVASRYGMPLFAVDLDERAVRICQSRTGVECVQATLSAIPFANARFDLVLLMDVLAHFQPGEDLIAFREAVRLLRPGGWLLLRTSALQIFRSRHSEFVWERQRYSAGQLRLLGGQAGLTIQRLTYANSLLSPIALVKFRVWEPLTRAQPSSGLVALPKPVEHTFYKALELESRLISKGINFPVGQSLYLLARKPM